MKKTLVAVSVIVILGAAWTGGAWYTGKQFQRRLPELVNDANSRLQSTFPQSGLRFAAENYRRGIFTSRVDVVLQSDGTTGDNKLLKPGEDVRVNEKVDHGPFPFAQLKKGVFIPSMASVHSVLAKTAKTQPLFDAAKAGVPLVAETRVGYSGNTVSKISVAAMDFQNDQTVIRASGGTFDVAADSDGDKLKVTGGIDSLVMGGLNQWQQREQLTLQDFSVDNDTHNGKQGYSIGDNTLKARTLMYNLDGKDILSIDSLSQVTHATEDDDKLSVQVNYALDALHIQGQNFGAGKLNISLSNLDGKAIEAFSDNYHQQVAQIMQQTGAVDPQQQQAQITRAFLQQLPTALKGSPYLTIAPLSWKNTKGESIFTLTLNLNDPAAAQESALMPDQQWARFVNKLDAKLTVPLDMATENTAQFARLQGYNEKDADLLAKQQVQGLAAMGQMLKLTTVADNTLTSSFHYVDNQINLNGQKISIQNFLGVFGVPEGAPQPAEPPAVPHP
ncbi:YdgA family protein [Candidatus Sodalis endolongispinus]|uniref:YdgA family protein n=1 Tax=Candidatus Sodalis endolongispinus TaxID=2812662 RepID=A0ABS5YEK3_9GAMM|nr:YdgA family protein [Candidatus Sodalis endolongispinus]MBT9433157.1 YdgA family protein [Candidatus Sodalis endolongispinus]